MGDELKKFIEEIKERENVLDSAEAIGMPLFDIMFPMYVGGVIENDGEKMGREQKRMVANAFFNGLLFGIQFMMPVDMPRTEVDMIKRRLMRVKAELDGPEGAGSEKMDEMANKQGKD